MSPTYSPVRIPERVQEGQQALSQHVQRLTDSVGIHTQRIVRHHTDQGTRLWGEWLGLQQRMAHSWLTGRWGKDAAQYSIDASQRMALTLDTLRERADNDQAHQQAGTPPVLDYDYDLVSDGANLPHPVNYMLLRIHAPQGIDTFDWKRPYLIIDPRAGHGAGIGGFKPDSQVGVALRGGHPVYFVAFRQHPEPGQTLADVMRAEAEFLREIARRHPDAPKPIVVGNCQGGWATLVLAAANPEITGPLVINGAPVSTWSGEVGANPMRYNGGLMGGITPALLAMDLGHGQLDGAHLVSNFEMLNPSRNYLGKYHNLYRNVDTERQSFLDFERWWGGYHFLNESEMRWIVEQIFIGNKLARGEAELEPGRHLDLKSIRSPIIVFASRGDNITPPQQALNWIVDTYADEHEIRIRGQRIIYMIHDKVGHLGIFVSSSIARKEHSEMASTLKTIEALAPGLYEMKIETSEGQGLEERFVVSFHERTVQDIVQAVDNDRELEKGFGTVAKLSQMGADIYDSTLRPWVQSMVTPHTAETLREWHPARLSRKLFGAPMPWAPYTQAAAQWAQTHRQPLSSANPWFEQEGWVADATMQSIDLLRDMRDAAYEWAFLSLYGLPQMHLLGEREAAQRTRKTPDELRHLPIVQSMLLGIENGGYEAAVIRILILLAESRGSVRRDRLERSAEVLTQREPFKSLTASQRSRLIHEQSVIVEFAADRAAQTLPLLLRTAEARSQAMETVHYIVGAKSDMEPHSLHLLEHIEAILGAEDTPAQAPLAPAEPSKASPRKRTASRAARGE